MKDFHSINTCNKPDFKAELDSIGFDYEYERVPGIGTSSGYRWVRFDIAEDNPNWPTIEKLLVKYQIRSHLVTRFSKRDFQMAEWFVARGTSWLGYPKPESNYTEITYDTGHYCWRCGIGLIQDAPFHISSSQPKAKNSSFFSPGWVKDELFVRVEVEKVLREAGVTGIEYLAPLRADTKESFQSITQILVKTILPHGLIVDGLRPVTCRANNEEQTSLTNMFKEARSGEAAAETDKPKSDTRPYCGQVKYRHPLTVQRYNREVFEDQHDFVKSAEWFGSGAEAHRKILVSRRVYDIIQANKWRGLRFAPIQLVG